MLQVCDACLLEMHLLLLLTLDEFEMVWQDSLLCMVLANGISKRDSSRDPGNLDSDHAEGLEVFYALEA